MNEKTKSSGSNLDFVKWIVVVLITAAGIYGYSYYSAESLLYRVAALLVLASIAGWLAATTAKGSAFVELVIAAKTEVRKVVWPTRAETTHTTLIVVVVVLIVALILWMLDSSLSWVISKFIG